MPYFEASSLVSSLELGDQHAHLFRQGVEFSSFVSSIRQYSSHVKSDSYVPLDRSLQYLANALEMRGYGRWTANISSVTFIFGQI